MRKPDEVRAMLNTLYRPYFVRAWATLGCRYGLLGSRLIYKCQPLVAIRGGAFGQDDLEEFFLQTPGYLTAFSAANRYTIDRTDRADLCCCSSKEKLIGKVKGCTLNDSLFNFDTHFAGDLDDGITRDAGQNGRTQRRGDQLSVIYQKDILTGAFGDISAIIESNCATPGCHVAGGTGTGNFTVFSELSEQVSNGRLLPSIRREASSIPMPPGGTLRACEIRQLELWVAAGAQNN